MLLPSYKTQWLPFLRGPSRVVHCLPLSRPWQRLARPTMPRPPRSFLPLTIKTPRCRLLSRGGFEGVENEGEGVRDAGDMEGDIMESPNSDSIDSSDEEEEEEIDDLSISYLDK